MAAYDSIVRACMPLLGVMLRKPLRQRRPSVPWRSVAVAAGRHFEALALEFSKERTAGAAMMVRMAAIMASFYRALLDAGVAAQEANTLASQMFRSIYRFFSLGPRLFARLRSSDPLRQVEIAFRLSLVFPQSAPGYDIRVREAGGAALAFDIYRCPVADYLAKVNMLDFCRASLCSSDFVLAESWGLALDRPRTIAGGSECCDFRFTEQNNSSNKPSG